MTDQPMAEIHFNCLTFPSFAFYRWSAALLSPELEPEVAVGLGLARLLGKTCPKSVLVEAEHEIAAYAWGASLEPFADEIRSTIPGAAVISSRLAPENFQGTLRFRLRCAPVIRRGGREIDAWTAAKPNGGTRADAYRDWLAPRLGGARLRTLSVAKAGSTEIRLPNQAPFTKPAAVLEGQIEVDDPISLLRTLENGVGRHGRLGFGTLILGRA